MLRLIAIALLMATALMSQSTPGEEKTAHLAFEAASVRINHSGALDFNTQTTPGRYTATNVPLRRLIRDAYQVRVFQIQNLPAWDPAQRFDINATMARPSRPADLQAMLKDLLATRFGLVLRQEMKEASVYSLVVAKTGPKLGNRLDGGVGTDRRFNTSQGSFKGETSIAGLAIALTAELQSIVTDKTGVEGVYAIDLKFVPEPSFDSSIPPPALNGVVGPSIFDAIQALGLTLERGKNMVPMLYVEQALKVPTEN